MGNIQQLCSDLAKKILDYTFLSDLVRLSLTSKFFRQYMNNPLFWQIIVDKRKIIKEFIKCMYMNYEKNTYFYPTHNIKNIYQCNGEVSHVDIFGNVTEINIYSFPLDVDQYYFFPTFRGSNIYFPSQNDLKIFYKIFSNCESFHMGSLSGQYLQKNNKFKSIYIYQFTSANEINLQLNNFSDTIDILMSHMGLTIENISKFKSIQTLSIQEIEGENKEEFKTLQTKIETMYIASISNYSLSIMENTGIKKLYIGENIDVSLLDISKLKNLVFLSFSVDFSKTPNIVMNFTLETVHLKMKECGENKTITIVAPNIKRLHIKPSKNIFLNFKLDAKSVKECIFEQIDYYFCSLIIPSCSVLYMIEWPCSYGMRKYDHKLYIDSTILENVRLCCKNSILCTHTWDIEFTQKKQLDELDLRGYSNINKLVVPFGTLINK